MKRKETKLTRRRLKSSYLTSVISISLVLFLLGFLGLLILNARKLSSYVKENITFSVILKENAKEVDIRQLQKNLDASFFVKSTEYISKEEAAEQLQKELGEDFIDFLGYNPLLASIDVYLYADYANPDSISWIENQLSEYALIKEVYYQKSLIHLINENVRKIGFFILLFSILLFIIALTLINNTIRLSVYSKRFIINTMQLVGATRAFIRKPFLIKSVIHGIYAAFISLTLLFCVLYFIQKEFTEVIGFQDIKIMVMLLFIVLFLGIILNWISTFFALQKFLQLQEDDLYY
jgi:cell division transport system permease protein